MKKTIITIVVLLAIVSTASAQIIGATNTQDPGRQPSNNSEYRQAGHYLNFEAGYAPLTIGYGYQINSNIMIKCGFGVVLSSQSEYNPFPLYFGARFSTPRNNYALFGEVRGLFNLNDHGDGTPLGFSGQVGILLNNFSFGAGLGFIDDGLAYWDEWYDGIGYQYSWRATDLIYLNFTISYNLPLSGLINKLR